MMSKRAPYQLRLPMLVYNSSMVVINFYFLLKSLVFSFNMHPFRITFIVIHVFFSLGLSTAVS